MHNTINQLSRTLYQANRYLCAQLEEQGIVGISPSHGSILMQLFEHDELPMSELAQLTGRDPSTVTALVKKLTLHDYATTAKQDTDKRVVMVKLTEKGLYLHQAFEEISKNLAFIQHLNLDPEDLETTSKTLGIIENNFIQTLKGSSHANIV